MIERASPVQLRKALEIANLFVKQGVLFIPMPVVDKDEFDKRFFEAIDKLAAMERAAAESERAAAHAAHDQKGGGNA